MTTPEEIAWAAGIFEGEGCVSLARRTKGGQHQFQMKVVMGDRDVVARFHEVMPFGHFRNKGRPKGGTKDMWEWHCGAVDQVQFMCELLWPWLGARRRGRIIELWAEVERSRSAPGVWREPGVTCKYGHYDWGKTSPNGKRRCLECNRIRRRAA